MRKISDPWERKLIQLFALWKRYDFRLGILQGFVSCGRISNEMYIIYKVFELHKSKEYFKKLDGS